MGNSEYKFVKGDIKVNVLGDVTGKTLIFTIALGHPIEVADDFLEEMKDIFPEAKEIVIVIGDFIKKIEIQG